MARNSLNIAPGIYKPLVRPLPIRPEWMNGQAWTVRRGVDYVEPAQAFLYRMYSLAVNVGMSVRGGIVPSPNGDIVDFQFVADF